MRRLRQNYYRARHLYPTLVAIDSAEGRGTTNVALRRSALEVGDAGDLPAVQNASSKLIAAEMLVAHIRQLVDVGDIEDLR